MGFERAMLCAAVFVCCAPPPPPAPVQQPPPYTPPPPPPVFVAPTVDPATVQAQQIAAQLKATMDAAAAAQVKREADKKAALEARQKQCEDTRVARADHDKLAAAANMDAETRLLTNAKAIQAACRLSTRKTGEVSVQPDGRGWKVSPQLADDVQCSSLPKGITKQDAYVVLWRTRDGSLKSSGPLLDLDDLDPGDASCADLDKAAGFDPRAAMWHDDASILKLAKWKPITPPPPASSP